MALFGMVRRTVRGLALGLMTLTAPAVASTASARSAPDSFAPLAGQLLPTVVNISTTQTVKADAQAAQIPDLPPDSPLQQLFKDYLKNHKLPRHVTSLGSGFVIDPSGLIVTNEHVIEDSDQITVTLNDGTSLPAKLLGRDQKTDLALLKVKPAKPLPAAHFGDSNAAHVGDWVIAIGNPFGLGSTVTAGIVSARNRDIAAGPYDDFIQTDAPINRGNSGGPLFDMSGNVIGVNSVIYSPSGGSVGIGFSIPSNMVREVVAQLRQYGVTKRGWLGVRVQQVTEDVAEGLGMPAATGALVADVTPGGPAAKSGMQVGDLITGFDGKPIPDSRALPKLVADTAVGKAVTVDFTRGGKKQTLHLTIARLDDGDDHPAPAKPNAPPTAKPNTTLGDLGLTLGALDAPARAKFHLGTDLQGVLVTNVNTDSPAGDNNMHAGDVIVQLEGQAVHSPDDVSKRLDADTKAGKKVELMLVSREGLNTFIALRLDGAG